MFIPQGGSLQDASIGISSLADELLAFIRSYQSQPTPSSPPTVSSVKSWKIFVESGTGTTALFLHQSLVEMNAEEIPVEVIAVTCVGSAAYLLQQMEDLDTRSYGRKSFPSILPDLKKGRKRIFGKLYTEHLHIWQELKGSTGFEFDLLYAPRAFEQIFDYFEDAKDDAVEYGYIYIHCGGTSGNESQLRRYANMGANVV